MHPPFPPRGPDPFMHGPRPGMGPGPGPGMDHGPGFGPRPRFPPGPNGPLPGPMPGPPDGPFLPPSKVTVLLVICFVIQVKLSAMATLNQNSLAAVEC